MSYPPQAYGQPGPASLDLPLYGATISQAFVRFFKKYATFTGRASRSEYWWVVLVSIIISIGFTVVGLIASGFDFTAQSETMTGPDDILSYLWTAVTLVPSLAVSVRRLHDIDRSGWWLLIGLIPLVGAVILIVWAASAPVPAGARYDLQARYAAPPGSY